jgi:hypothetical protein
MNPIELKAIIESIFGVIRNNQGRVTNYGLMGQYQYQNGFTNTAFAIGQVPEVNGVTGLECVLNYPQARQIKPLSTGNVYSEKIYRLSLVQHTGKEGINAVMLLERSAQFQCLEYIYIPASPEIGNYPQWNLTFKIYELREKL